jgi:thioester reductase-like protein
MKPTAVFLTGATGFVGGNVCAELLLRTDATIYCLARGATLAGARKRLHAHTAAEVQANAPAYATAAWHQPFDPERVIAVHGDVTAPRFGLPAADYDELADTVDVVYHCAGSVNLAARYSYVAPTNLGGTRQVLRFARHRGEKPLHYVSTAGVFLRARQQRRPVVRESTVPTPGMSDVVGYTQSKGAAEAEVRRAGKEGLPTAIYRPGLVLGHRRTGSFSDTELSVRLMRGAITVEFAPTTTSEIPAAPVDHIARAVVTLAQTPDALGAAWHPNATLHIADIFRHARAFGYPLRDCSVEQWRQTLLTAADSVSAYLVLAVWELMRYILAATEHYRPPTLDCTATNRVLARYEIVPPALDGKLFTTIIDRIARAGLMASPIRDTTQQRKQQGEL